MAKKSEKKSSNNTSLLERIISSDSGSKVVKKADKMAGVAYRRIRHGQVKKVSSKKRKKKKYKEDFSQSIVPIKVIRNGIIETTTGMYVKILEIYPIDYNRLTMEQRDVATQLFSRMFSTGNHNVHIKVINTRNNPQPFIKNIKDKCEEERYQCIQSGRPFRQEIVDCAEDKIKTVKEICSQSSVMKRFFLIFKYEGHSSDYKTIYTNLLSMERYYVTQFSKIGNIVKPLDDNELAELLYQHFNKKTSQKETYEERLSRCALDLELYNSDEKHKKKREILYMDVLAPKGARFTNDEFIFQDGMYISHLVLTSNGHPGIASPGWVSRALIGDLDGVEVDVYTKMLAKEYIKAALEQKTKFDINSAGNIRNNYAKQERAVAKVQNTAHITRSIQNGEDIFDTVIIITITSESLAGLNEKKAILKRAYKTYGIKAEDSYQLCWEFYKATLPLMDIPTSLFTMFSRNYLSSSIKSLYPFIATQMRDPSGYVFGVSSESGNPDIISVNFFNSKYFKNPHIFVEGTSGSGKTFSMEVIARSMRLLNTRIMCICPAKAFEYRAGCEAIGGQFINLSPGSPDCINIMEIFPKDENADAEEASTSLLADKISFLTIWIGLLAGKSLDDKKMSILSTIIRKMYFEFGITDDDESIWEDESHTKTKPMPFLVNLWETLDGSSEFTDVVAILQQFVDGQFENFNKPTNVDLSNKFIVFDVDEMKIGKRLFAALFYIPFYVSYTIGMQNRQQKDLIFFEEAWKVMRNQQAAEQVMEMVRLLRSYGTGVVFGTQEMADMMKNDSGKAILNNTSTKLIFCTDGDANKVLAENIDLTVEERSRIESFRQGECLLIANNQKVFMEVQASEKEALEFETDPNKIQANKQALQKLHSKRKVKN